MYRRLRLEILKNFDTQADFAAAARTHDTKVSQVLHGRRKLTKQEADAWAKALGCDRGLLSPVTRKPCD
jgi:plasmid maintenance system antidote protein VapI